MSTLLQFLGGTTPLASNQRNIELLVVGGGGGGWTLYPGGAGRMIWHKSYTVTIGTVYTVTVGAGGAGGSTGGCGTSSVFDSATAGGGDGHLVRGNGSGSAGKTVRPSILTSEFWDAGNRGGFANGGYYPGGGGAGSPGGDAISNTAGGPGGAGLLCDISGSLVGYAGGGGGGIGSGYTPGSGGDGGGGNGGSGSVNGTAGAANTGGGGGGGGSPGGVSAAGGSGVVIIAYPNTYAVPAAITGTYDQPARSGYRVYRFTGSGSITF